MSVFLYCVWYMCERERERERAKREDKDRDVNAMNLLCSALFVSLLAVVAYSDRIFKYTHPRICTTEPFRPVFSCAQNL